MPLFDERITELVMRKVRSWRAGQGIIMFTFKILKCFRSDKQSESTFNARNRLFTIDHKVIY